MLKDSSGNELPIAQSMYDALKISDAEMSESLGQLSGASPTELAALTLNYHRAQIVTCLESVATLESYIRGLQEASGIEEVPYTAARGFLEPTAPSDS